MTLLIIDIGSSSVRALLFDDQARPVPGAVVTQSHQFLTDASGAATADPHHLRDIVEHCIDTILIHPAADQIRAVGMATFVGNLMGVDERGEPLTPLYTYADTRSHDDV
ncbi:MAG TPA: FGGY family carbohydrate kinase, partial [Phototrophicaceae bacterium]|nr:FGGY family carbohydrate kinase [Phototrophicaceae bacterium]